MLMQVYWEKYLRNWHLNHVILKFICVYVFGAVLELISFGNDGVKPM